MNDFEKLSGVVRHLLSAIGGVVVYRGGVTQDEAELVIGGVMTVFAVVWSVYSKNKQ